MRPVRLAAAVATAAATFSLGSAGLTAGTAAGAAAAPAGSPWPETGYNAAASRADLAESTLTVRTEHRVRLLRQLTEPAVPPNNCIRTTGFVAPVLADGRVFAVANGRLVSYDAATGHRLWRVLPDPTYTSDYYTLAVSHGLVITAQLGCDSVSDPNGYVDAFRESTGAPAWHTSASGIPVAQVAVSGGYVVSVGVSAAGGQVIIVRHVSSGAIAWQRFPSSSQGSPALVVGGLVVQQVASGLVAYKLGTGARAWSRAGTWLPERGDLSGTAARHLYVVNQAGQVADLRPQTGRTQRVLAGATSVLAVDNARAYAACGTGHVCAYRASDGKLRWSRADGSALGAEAGGVLYLSDGKALDAATGALLRQIYTFSAGASGLAVGEGRVAAALGSRKLDLFGLPGS